MDQPAVPSLLDTVRMVLAEEIRHPGMERFALAARLREDLGIDSVILMELLVRLETGHGFEVPKTALDSARLITIGDLLAQFGPDQAGTDIAPRPRPAIDPAAGRAEARAAAGVHGEMPMDIKVHCYVSCLCDGLKRRDGIDHRPFYAAIPDSPFALDDRMRIRYHAAGMTHGDFRHWFASLYGATITPVADADTLLTAAEYPVNGIDTMVMVDLHRLPERENPFDRDPFPHYALLAPHDEPGKLLMRDVDFRWEGPIAADRLAAAMASPHVSGGFLIDHRDSRPPEPAALAAFFRSVIRLDVNPFATGLRRVLAAHAGARATRPLADLPEAVAELPILVIRKYAYEHVIAYFWRTLGRDTASFDFWADEIERLVQGYRSAHFECAKLAAGQAPVDTTQLERLITGLEALEGAIKAEILRCTSELEQAA